MNGNYFYQPPTRQDNINMINEQINRLEQMRNQIVQQPTQQQQQQQPSINQTFQLAPTAQSTLRYVNTMDDVAKEMVFGDTAFFSKDMSIMWLKNSKGEIKSYELTEIIQKDEKDMIIESLKMQVDEMNKTLKEMKENAKSIIANDDATITSEESPSVPVSRTSKTTKK